MSEQSAYDKGFQDALRCFAHWRDGAEFVGTCGMTLARAIEERHRLHTYDPPPTSSPGLPSLAQQAFNSHDGSYRP